MDILPPDPSDLAIEMVVEMNNLTQPNTASMRRIRKNYSRKITSASSDYVFNFARRLCFDLGQRWAAYEIIANQRDAFRRLGETELEEFGRGINSWWTVDSFARTLSGPAWLNNQIKDELIYRWAASPDMWWRRAALVSTVALNLRSQGGMGDVQRTLSVCQCLVDDHEEMIVKAMSWALRELVFHNPEEVNCFLDQNDHSLAALIKREVKNKLSTGLKTPKRKGN